jgi:hypothetical protein
LWVLRLKSFEDRRSQENCKVLSRKVTAVKASRQCLIVLLVKVGWRQGRALASEEGKRVVVDYSSTQRRKVAEHLSWEKCECSMLSVY